ncbi:hypothetical protein RhiJN_19025 [Ceratobasidium sp. AG-Ba]|nr:hypothetical protein RhiJN_19025 [Ceratobasidium sp. AG-Ba]
MAEMVQERTGGPVIPGLTGGKGLYLSPIKVVHNLQNPQHPAQVTDWRLAADCQLGKRKIDSDRPTSSSHLQSGTPLQPVALNAHPPHLNHRHASAFAPASTVALPYPSQHQGTLAQPYWANYGSSNETKRTLVHSTYPGARLSGPPPTSHPYNHSPLGNNLLPAADLDLIPDAKRARVTPSLPSASPPETPISPLPITSASLPKHLQAFTRAAPRPRAHIIVADVHRMGRVAVHADVFAQIVEQEERIAGPGAAWTRRARRRDRARPNSGSGKYNNGSNATTPNPEHDRSSVIDDTTDLSPPWPDTQYPWSLIAVQVEDKRVRARHAELAHVERWLESAEDELDENEEPAWNSSNTGLEGGLSVLDDIPGYPTGPLMNSSLSDSVASDEDGADARTALLARASVQEFIARRTARAVVQHTPSGDVVRCICRGGADGRPMIQCSDCRTWAHRICMDAPGTASQWRCWRCAPALPAASELVVAQPTFVPNSTPGRRIAARPPLPTRAVQWQPSPLLPSVPLPETPERAAPFPFHTFITPRFFADFARRDDDEGDADMVDGSPTRSRPPPNPLSLQPSPATPPPIRSNGNATPMTPERSAGPRPHPQHSGSTVADSAGPASPAIVGGTSVYASNGACNGPDVFISDVSVYTGEDSPVRHRRVHRSWQLGNAASTKIASETSARRGDEVAR